jgi:SAM-dependent methyltransferase
LIDQNDKLKNLYIKIINEYNSSSLAKEEGFVHNFSDDKLNEIKICAKYLQESSSIFLDIGTGSGIAPRLFSYLGYKSITLDNPISGGNALKNISEFPVEVISCDILSQPIPLNDGSIDCILFADVIEHLLHSPRTPIIEFLRILKPGGVVVATTPNSMRISVRLKVLLGFSNWPSLKDFYFEGYHGGHHHEYTKEEFIYAFEQAGFYVSKFELSGTSALVQVPSLRDLQTKSRAGKNSSNKSHPLVTIAKLPIFLLEKLFPSLRPQMLLIAIKPS